MGADKRARPARPPIPDATVARLPLYLRALVAIAETGATTVSSETLAAAAGVNSAKVRKDLSALGSYGTRGVGYDVWHLIHEVRDQLGLSQHWPIVIAGIGNLGQALAHYRGFTERGFRVAALVDVDPAKLGHVDRRAGGASARGPRVGRGDGCDRHRRDRDARVRRAGGRGPDGRGGSAIDPELRAGGGRGARGRDGAEGGSRGGAADPRVLRTAGGEERPRGVSAGS